MVLAQTNWKKRLNKRVNYALSSDFTQEMFLSLEFDVLFLGHMF